MRGPINASPGLRWWLFSNFGASRICPEMLKQGVGLQMQSRGPVVGRYFPNQCSVDVDDDRQVVVVNFAGTGYAFNSVSKRVGFSATGSVEYRMDFYLGEEDLYLWGKVNRIIHGPDFRLGYVENPLVDIPTAVTPLGQVANSFGNQIMVGKLTRGFTVVYNEDKGKDFSLGVLTPPQKPHHPFNVTESEHYTFANETIEVHSNQRDFLGPFEVVDEEQRLAMRFFLEGPAVDVMVVDKRTGDAWREAYQLGRPLGPPPGPVLAGAPLGPNRDTRPSYRLAPGLYYVVIDHTAYAGVVAPPGSLNPLYDPVARISYVAQLVED